MFFSKIFGKKQEYLNTFEDCCHCANGHLKLKKCHDCKERIICKTCFKTEKLCVSCDEKYNEWAKNVKDTISKVNKQDKYGYSNEEMAGALV